jgi:hypothetical protein
VGIACQKGILDAFKKEDVYLGADGEAVCLWKMREVVLPNSVGILELKNDWDEPGGG